MDGTALVYCEGFFNTSWGKTAHGLVRFTNRYRIAGVIDSRYAGEDAGMVLDGKYAGIPVFHNVEQALNKSANTETANTESVITHVVFGIAPDGGMLSDAQRADLLEAVRRGCSVDAGLHYFLSDDPEFAAAAEKSGSVIRDIRKTPPRNQLHPFTGRIREVGSVRIALLGTDSAVGKRTTAWKLVQALEAQGYSAEFIGTGQTAWMQGAEYCVVLDSLINDFVAGEIEHAVLSAWTDKHPEFMVIEGQGSLMNPLYPGGFEILAAAQPHAVVLQHAPLRTDYDGLNDAPIHPLGLQIQAIELISGKPVIAVTINHEKMNPEEIRTHCDAAARESGLPTVDPLTEPLDQLVETIVQFRPASFA